MSNEQGKGQGSGKGTTPVQQAQTPAEDKSISPEQFQEFAEDLASRVSAKMEEKHQAQREKDQLAHAAEIEALKQEMEALRKMKPLDPSAPAAPTKELLYGRIDPDNLMEPRLLFCPRYATVITHKKINGYAIPVPTPDGKPLEFYHMSTINSQGLNGETMQRLLSCVKIEHKDLWDFLTKDAGCGFGTLYFDNPGLASQVDTGVMQRASRHLQSVIGIDSQQVLSEMCHRYNIADPYNKDITVLKMELAAAMAQEEIKGEMRLLDESALQAQRESQLAMR